MVSFAGAKPLSRKVAELQGSTNSQVTVNVRKCGLTASFKSVVEANATLYSLVVPYRESSVGLVVVTVTC